MRVGIVGNGTDKFTEAGKRGAISLIYELLTPDDTLVSGHSPVGGIDIWAEEVAEDIGCKTDIKAPITHSWSGRYGYRARNLDIAKSEIVHVILADVYPEEYAGRRFKVCYHCIKRGETEPHVKSGGCWTGWQALDMGNSAEWYIVKNYPGD